ncbi:MAG: hypothetical protein DI534_01860 [Leifsonia xyli]|nr:MAG: hypothetical protein DI534_01860 [Leifsonia xyli]
MRRIASAALVVAVGAALALAGPLAASAEEPSPAAGDGSVAGKGYPGSPEDEARIVATEDARISSARAIANATQWTGVNGQLPFRLAQGAGYTLVLPARAEPYTFDELLRFLPRTLVRQQDGSYLLSDDIIVDQGATLSIRSRDGLVLKLASSANDFASIVTVGGSLEIIGDPNSHVTVESWDDTRGAVDTDTSDGRAYVRVMGGRAAFSSVDFANLGFWSGLTGGVSLSGIDTSSVFAPGAVGTSDGGNKTVYGSELLPVGDDAAQNDLGATGAGATNDFGYVSALVSDTSFHANAFGLFVTGADGVDIRDSEATGNLVDGIVFHRYVSNSSIRNTLAADNGQDGVALRRASTGIIMDRLTVRDNRGNGVTINGASLADGPSATGMSTGTYGNNELTASTIRGNGRYGVEVIGGVNTRLTGNTVSGSEMGIVVNRGAQQVQIKDNTLTDVARQGIALRDGVSDSEVSDNEVTGGENGIYARDSSAKVTRNTIEEVTRHGITFVGDATGAVIQQNTVSGRGLSAVDVARATGATVGENEVEAWVLTKPWDVVLRSIFQPLTVMWIVLGLIVLITALTGLGRRRAGEVRNPYANLAPLASFSRGEVARDEIDVPPRHRREEYVEEARAS